MLKKLVSLIAHLKRLEMFFVGKLKKLTLNALPNIKAMILPALKEIEEITVQGLTGLKSASFPELGNFGTGFFKDLANLEEIYWPKLGYFEYLEIVSLVKIKSLSFPELGNFRELHLYNLANIESIYWPKLKYFYHLKIISLEKVKILSFPELNRIGSLDVKDNNDLEEALFSKLTLIEMDAFFTNNHKAVIKLDALKDVKSSLLFNVVGDVKISLLEYVGQLKFQNVASTRIEILNLIGCKNSIHIGNNLNLGEIDAPQLGEVQGLGFSVVGNSILNKMNIPVLKHVKGLFEINEPSLKILNYSKDLHGESSKVIAAIDCGEFSKLRFSQSQCYVDADKAAETGKGKGSDDQSERDGDNSPNDKSQKQNTETTSSSNAFSAMPAVSGLVMVGFFFAFLNKFTI